jgi:hypothetical protein
MALTALIEPRDEGELALVKSLLDGNDIRYVVRNEHFGSLYPGFPLPFNARTVMVEQGDFPRAKTLVGELIRGWAPTDERGR